MRLFSGDGREVTSGTLPSAIWIFLDVGEELLEETAEEFASSMASEISDAFGDMDFLGLTTIVEVLPDGVSTPSESCFDCSS